MTCYYNEIDPFCAAWLRELIANELIAPGHVDERSIEDVRPDDLAGYTQCHFFAGIGGWSYALRLAGWPDNVPVWTGSCPCQPFSAAGKGAGFDDERHLWPYWHWLVQQLKPSVIFGEQVANKAAEPWIDLVQTDLEAMDYAFGIIPFPAAGVGAPHIRDRAYWVASDSISGQPSRAELRDCAQAQIGRYFAPNGGSFSGMADGETVRRQQEYPRQTSQRSRDSEKGNAAGFEHGGSCSRLGHSDSEHAWRNSRAGAQSQGENDCGTVGHEPRTPSTAGGLADTTGSESGQARAVQPSGQLGLQQENGSGVREGDSGTRAEVDGGMGPSPTNGRWADVDWLGCRDGKFRPVEPGTFPLADGLSARVGRLRGYGNAIEPDQAAEFVRAFCEVQQ
ncbi:MAG: DNA cytosine methyltransferase [Pseudomonadota bacterium]